MDQRWGVGVSGGSVERGNLTPDREALIYFGSPLGRAEPMPSWSKVRGDGAKGRQEPLGMPHRFKAFHRPFALWPPRSFQRKNNDYGGAESLTCDDSVQGQLMALFGLTLAASL